MSGLFLGKSVDDASDHLVASSLREQIYNTPNIPALFAQINNMPAGDWDVVVAECAYDHVIFGFLAVWAKLLCRDKAHDIYRFVHETREARSAGAFPMSLERMTPAVRSIAIQNLSVLQLTYGCVGNCRYCDAAAPLPVFDGSADLDHMPLHQATNVLDRSSASSLYSASTGVGLGGVNALYNSSDLMSYPHIVDVARKWKERTGFGIILNTNFPPGCIDNLITLLREGLINPGHGCISMTSYNRNRITKELFNRYDDIGPYIGLSIDDLRRMLLPSYSSEDFILFIPYAGSGYAYEYAPKIPGLGANMPADCLGTGGRSASCGDGLIVSSVGAFNHIAGIEPSACYPTGEIIVPIDEVLSLNNTLHYVGQPVDKLLGCTFAASRPVFDSRGDQLLYNVVDAQGRRFGFECVKLGMQFIVVNIRQI